MQLARLWWVARCIIQLRSHLRCTVLMNGGGIPIPLWEKSWEWQTTSWPAHSHSFRSLETGSSLVPSRTHTIHACVAHAKSAKQFINDAWRRKERSETRSHVYTQRASLVTGRMAEGTRRSGSTPEAPDTKQEGNQHADAAAGCWFIERAYCGGGRRRGQSRGAAVNLMRLPAYLRICTLSCFVADAVSTNTWRGIKRWLI
jgi:hypothetical protein